MFRDNCSLDQSVGRELTEDCPGSASIGQSQYIKSNLIVHVDWHLPRRPYQYALMFLVGFIVGGTKNGMR